MFLSADFADYADLKTKNFAIRLKPDFASLNSTEDHREKKRKDFKIKNMETAFGGCFFENLKVFYAYLGLSLFCN